MDKLIFLLEQLATKLGVTTDMLWVALLRQAKLYAIAYIIAAVVLIAITVVEIKWARWASANDAGEGHILGSLVMGMVLLFGWFVFFCEFSVFLAALFNPEYWALNKILSVLS